MAGLGYFQTFGAALGRGLAVSHAMESHHPKGIDYWYLHYAAVRPEHQGKGWGGAAIREGRLPRGRGICQSILRRPKMNVAPYLKLGFKVLGEWDVPKGGPHFWSMLYEVF